ncbi:tyrosine-type recombinase/integrase [Halalkalibacter oceani]|uniref:tyrosine-type recombinase/integrase n=1 Tax=Halalkalibacter oceani TaxID=1653776 RepID=UPI00339AF162
MSLQLVHINKVNCLEIIMMYLKSNGRSENTIKNYLGDIRHFFKITKGKELENLIEHDFKVTVSDIDKFIAHLQDEGSVNKTIKRKLTTITGLFSYINSRKIEFGLLADIDISFISKMQKLKSVEVNYGLLHKEEVEEMIKIAPMVKEGMPRFKNRIIQGLLIKFALHTGLRQQEILKLKWSDFILTREGDYEIELRGKGQRRKIHYVDEDFFQELIDNKVNDEVVFPFNKNHISKLMNQLKIKMNISEKRNVSFHSIRGTAITIFYENSKDPHATMEFAGHSDFNVTKRYIKENKYKRIGVLDFDKFLNSDALESLSKEELLDLINSNKVAKIILLRNLNSNL